MSSIPTGTQLNLNPISCTTCRQRKLRCSRNLPTCKRCQAHDAECTYPGRQSRRKKPTEPAPSAATQGSDVLSRILDRLDKLESLCGQANSPDAERRDNGELLRESRLRFRHRAQTDSPRERCRSESIQVPDVCRAQTLQPSPWSSIARNGTDPDAMTVLQEAMDQLQRLMIRIPSTTDTHKEFNIPRDVAKVWIDKYFKYMRVDMFPNLLNEQLIRLLPDLIGLPHIHFDASIIIVYYNVLYHGCILDGADLKARGDDGRLIYQQILRLVPVWEREASGTVVDFIAATLMMRVAAENLDPQLSWKFQSDASYFAHGLNLRNLDNNQASDDPSTDVSQVDSNRRGFWELIQLDYFFQLIFDKPPTVTATTWKVNLPQLASEQPHGRHAATNAAFLVASRTTFVIIDFFDLTKDATSKTPELVEKVDDLARQIEAPLVDWQIDAWLRQSLDNHGQCWILLDLMLTGYASIVAMYRKLETLGHFNKSVIDDFAVSESPLALKACRRMIQTIILLMQAHPSSKLVSWSFGAYQSFIAIAYVYKHVLKKSDTTTVDADFELLQELSRSLHKVVGVQNEFLPLLRAILALNSEVQTKISSDRQ